MDVIADMLTRMRNALRAGKGSCTVPVSRTKLAILEVMKKEGYIENFVAEGRDITVTFRYNAEGKPLISSLKRVSKPGKRIYVGAPDVPWVLNGLGTAIISTHQGFLTDAEARARNTGGEVICYIW